MLANEILEKYVRKDVRDNVGVIGVFKNGGWWHIHGDEIIPKDVTIALHPRINLINE